MPVLFDSQKLTWALITHWSLEDKPGAMDDRDGWWERVLELRALSVTWWWWWWYGYRKLEGKVFANSPGDRGSIPDRVVRKTQKWYLVLSCLRLRIIMYVSREKWSNPGKGVARPLTPRCSSYRKGSLPVTLDYDNIYTFTYIHTDTHVYIYIYIWICYSF